MHSKVLFSVLRSIKRLLSLCKEVAFGILGLAVNFDGSRPFGPASTFKHYLTLVGWDLHVDATLSGPDHFRINLVDDSAEKICRTFRQAWPTFLVSNLARKGTGNVLPHHSLTTQVLSKFAPDEQAWLVRNIVGGFQTAATQKLWDPETPISCPLCGLDDNRPHRRLECHKLPDIRANHMEAIDILQNERPDWVYIPIV